MDKFAVKHLVVDSGAFIKHSELHNVGEAIYTLSDVISEVRDKATRERLQVLPYELRLREPTPEAIKIVTEFARKTGDLRTLSATDLRVIALTYTLQKEFDGIEHIRTQPTNKVQYVVPQKESAETNVTLPGFYVKKNKSKNASKLSCSTSECCTPESVDEAAERLEHTGLNDIILTKTADVVTPSENPAAIADRLHLGDSDAIPRRDMEAGGRIEEKTLDSKDDDTPAHGDTQSTFDKSDDDEYVTDESGEDNVDAENNDDDDDDGDDEEGWITPGNIEAMKQASVAHSRENEAHSLIVACITTDYAMQNVLVQMGLHVMSVNGMLIHRTTSKILRCYGCFKVMPDCEHEFCSHCGNATLSRITVAYNDDGTVQYFLSRHKKFTTRGLRYSLPQPKGGKYSNNPILCADQREAQKRTSKLAKVKIDVFDDDYTARGSPFAPIDIYSRSAMLGYNTGRKMGRTGAGHRPENPNENKKHYGHKK